MENTNELYMFKNITISMNGREDGTIITVDTIIEDIDGNISHIPCAYVPYIPIANTDETFEFNYTYFIGEVIKYLADGKYHNNDFFESIVETAFTHGMMPKIKGDDES